VAFDFSTQITSESWLLITPQLPAVGKSWWMEKVVLVAKCYKTIIPTLEIILIE